MKKIILAIITVMVPLMLSAGSTDFWFRHFSVEDGLSSSAVRAIMQDKYGFMSVSYTHLTLPTIA